MTLTFAERLLQTYGITQPEEIDIEAIAYDQGAEVRYRRLDSCEARIVGYGPRAVITIDSDAHPRRKRFSLGHELGHWIQDKGVIATACSRRDIGSHRFSASPSEAQANGFAAQILLPSYIFDPRADAKPFTFATVEPLAGRFQASVTATAIKMVMSGHHLGMVVCYSDGSLQWAARGPDFPWQLRPVRLLDDDSVAYDLWKGRDGTGRPTLQSAETWIDCEGAEDYELTEDTRLVAAGTTLSLLWWKDEGLVRRFPVAPPSRKDRR